jgi:PiT family inorganic phosphate transporter
VNWRIAGRVLAAWAVTLPSAAGLAAGAHALIDALGTRQATSSLAASLVALVGCAALWILARRRPVTPDNVNAIA